MNDATARGDAQISQDPSRWTQEQKAKAIEHELAKERQYANAYGEASPSPPATDYGALGPALDRPARPSLQERVAKQWHHAKDEARNCERLNELHHLLAKNPDVARILDLMEIVRG